MDDRGSGHRGNGEPGCNQQIVIPAHAGIQAPARVSQRLDSRFRGNDGKGAHGS